MGLEIGVIEEVGEHRGEILLGGGVSGPFFVAGGAEICGRVEGDDAFYCEGGDLVVDF